MEQEQTCQEQCKFQRDGTCALEKCDFIAPVHGAACLEHLLEDEAKTYY